eukprot:7222416-Alexandrium_andersonii.AAC.1
MSASLVGSEMCIRDRNTSQHMLCARRRPVAPGGGSPVASDGLAGSKTCAREDISRGPRQG